MFDSWTPILLTAAVVLFLLAVRSRKQTRKFLVPAVQSIASPTRQKGESPIYRHPLTPHGTPLMAYSPDYPHVRTYYDAFQNGVKNCGPEPCFGVRINDGPYVWETYNEVNERVTNFGSGLLECGLVPKKQHYVGVMGKNCPEWVIAELACMSYSLVLVPLYDTFGPDALQFIINQTELSLVVVEEAKLKVLLEAAPGCPSLKYVVKMNSLTQDDKQLAKQAKISLLYFKGLESLGRDTHKKHVPSGADDLITICYTSGTTGDPKGVMLSQKNLLADISAVQATLPPGHSINHQDVHLSFLPLAHIFEQLIVAGMLCVGGRIAFYRGDVLKLLEDVAACQPTFFPAVPRLLNRIYSKINQTVSDSSPVRKFLFAYALKQKKALLERGIVTKDSFWDKLVFKKVQARLGGRVRMMVTGAAPIAADVLDFFRCAFGCEVVEGYGQTETSAAACVTRFGDYSTAHGGHVGAVMPCCEIKLVDIPDMNYLSTDKNPRGEIWVRGNNVFSGYFKNPEKTKETLTSDGWCMTGDVGMILPGGTIKIIDRKKNIFKLSQGEYIAPEKIENIYLKAPFVAQVFVYGESVKSALVGIVVVDHDQIATHCKETGISQQTTDSWLNGQKELKQKILEGMVASGKAQKLHSFEQIKRVHLTWDLWTPDNGMLTPSMKPKRHEIKKKYQQEIDKMYETLD